MFNINTQEKVTAFEAHPDYIRCLAVHPTQSLILTGSDDMTIKLWDWDKGWKCVQVRRRASSQPANADRGLRRSTRATRTTS